MDEFVEVSFICVSFHPAPLFHFSLQRDFYTSPIHVLTMCFVFSIGEYHCPVLNKVFTEFTHIVAVKTTGNVFCYEV